MDNIIPKLKKYLRTFSHEKLKDEFIEKITGLYCTHSIKSPIENKKIKFQSNLLHIKTLWGWLKGILKEDVRNKSKISNLNKSLQKSQEKQNISVIKTVKGNRYRDFCKDLMMTLEIESFEKFKSFVFNIINKYAQKSKMAKTKKILSFSPQYYKN